MTKPGLTLYQREIVGRDYRGLSKPVVFRLRRARTKPWSARRPGMIRVRFATFDDAIHYATTGEKR